VKQTLIHTWTVLDKKERKRFVLLAILDIFISIADILSLVLLLWIIRFYIQPGQNINISFLPGWLADRHSILFIAIFFLLFALKNGIGYLIARAHYAFIGDVAIRITHNNLQNYQQSAFEEFITIDSSVHIRKISLQPFEFCQHILSGIQQIITQLCLIVITIIAIIVYDAKLFLLLFCILLPPVIAIFYFIKGRLNKARKHIQSSNERSFQYLLDALKGYVESNIYDRHDFFMQRYIGQRKKFGKHLFDSISIQNLPPRIIEVFAVLGLFILIAIANGAANADTHTLITIGAFMAAAYKIIPGIVKIMNTVGQIKAYEFTVDDLVQNKQPGETSDQKKMAKAIHSIQLKKISYSYSTQPVLNDLSIDLSKGDFLGVSGKSGRGKTTILNLLLGFLSPKEGQVFVNNVPVKKEQLQSYWPVISYVRQQSFFIYDTLLKNITLEEEDYDKQRLQSALKAAGLEELVASFPEGLDKVITENGKNISGGQQQRIAIARALYKNADLILLDEPFNELDEASVASMLDHFQELARQGKIVIMITHDSKSLSWCTKTLALDEQG
jgi:ABC-type bacteriocin/lantibiotic exporter with double-glycine peptidase domain